MVATADPGAARAPMSRRDVFDAVAPRVEIIANVLVGRNRQLATLRDDMIQEGLMELWRVAGKYDPARSNPVTFAEPRIRGAMLHWVRVRRSDNGINARVAKRHKEQGRFVPSCVSYGSFGTAKGLRAPDARAGRSRFRDLPPASSREPADSQAEEFMSTLKRSRTVLTKSERTALTDYFANNLTMQEIAERAGVSESRVSQVIANALGRIRETMLADGRTNLN